MDRLLASEIFMSSWKRGKSSKHPQCFCSEDEILLLKGQQSMCKQGQHQAPHPPVLGPPRPAACRTMHLSKGEGGGGLLQRWRRLRLSFSSELWGWVCSCSFVPFCIVTLESKGILWRATAHFEWLSVHPEHRKGTLAAALHAHILIHSTQSTKATATPAEASAEFPHPDREGELPLPLSVPDHCLDAGCAFSGQLSSLGSACA